MKKTQFICSQNANLYVSTSGDPSTATNCLLILPPLLEEMNASRHLQQALASQLAEQGWLTVQFDLLGTGDSEGELAQVNLSDWRQNLQDITQFIANTYRLPLHLLAIRSGALLIPTETQSLTSVIGWHPTWSGKQWRKELNRMMLLNQEKQVQGELIQLSGYQIHPGLFDALAQREVATEQLPLLLSLYSQTALPPSIAKQERTARKGTDKKVATIQSSPFWLHNELPIEHFSDWVEKTCQALHSALI